MGDKTIQGNKTIITAVILCACFTALWVTGYAVMANFNLGNVIDEKFLNTFKMLYIFKPVVLFLGVFISAAMVVWIIFLIARKKNPKLRSSAGFAFVAVLTVLPLIAFAVIVTPRIMDVLPADQYTRSA